MPDASAEPWRGIYRTQWTPRSASTLSKARCAKADPRFSTPTKVRNSPARHLPTSWKPPGCGSAWTAVGAGWTTSQWVRFYNERRPHQALGYKTPAATWAAEVSPVDLPLRLEKRPDRAHRGCERQGSENYSLTSP